MMLKQKLILIFILCFALKGKTQYIVFDSVYFNDGNHLNEEVESAWNICKFGNEAVSVFLGDNVSTGVNISFLNVTDSMGNEKYRYTFPNTHQYYYNPSGICQINQGFVTVGTFLDTSRQDTGQIMFVKFTQNLDSLDYKTYQFSLPTGQINQIIYDGVNSIYGVGFTKVVGIYPDLQVVKFDTLGDLIWKQKYGLSNRNETALTLQIVRNDKILIGGFSNEGNSADGIALMLDTAGNQLWMKYPDVGSSWNVFAGAYQTPDGGYLCPGHRSYTSSVTGTGYQSATCITKLDSAGNVKWVKTHDLGPYDDAFGYCFIDTTDTTIIAVGGNNNVPQYHEAGLAVKYTMQGDTVWTRTYDKSYNKNSYIDHFYRGIPTTDGGYLFAGQTSSGIIDGKQDAWLLKTDSIGCHPNYPCWPATHYDYSGIKENVYSSLNLTVFPNPANSYVCIRFKNSYQNNACTLRLYNSSGQLVKEEKQVFSAPLITIKTEDLPQGLYLLEVETVYGKERVKVVKE